MNPLNWVFRASFMVIASDPTFTKVSQVSGVFVGLIDLKRTVCRLYIQFIKTDCVIKKTENL